MANLLQIVRDIRGIYSDRGRDRLPAGSVWVLSDWVPLRQGTQMRGAWKYQSPALAFAPDGMIYAPYQGASKLLVMAGTQLINVVSAVSAPVLAVLAATRQNPVFHRNKVVIPAANGTSAASVVSEDGSVASTPISMGTGTVDDPIIPLTGRYAIVWKDRVVLANMSTQPQMLVFSKPGNPLLFNTDSVVHTSFEITGLGAQRTQILAFHASSVERIRGTTVADSEASAELAEGDLILDTLWDKAGCFDARSIANWQDNILFCDAHGIFLTDGAVVRDITWQAGVSNVWLERFEMGGVKPDSIAGVVHKDYYIVTIRHTGQPPVTFVTDLNNKRVWTFSNIDSTCFTTSIGVGERLYGAHAATKKVTDLTPTFRLDPTILQVDANGLPVLPVLSTGFMLVNDKPGKKRIKDLQVDYLADRDDDQEVIRTSVASSPTGDDRVIGQLRPLRFSERRLLPVRRSMEGISVTLEQMQPTRDTRLIDINVTGYPEEQHRV